MSEEKSKQKVVLITGCSSGIGFATAVEFSKYLGSRKNTLSCFTPYGFQVEG